MTSRPVAYQDRAALERCARTCHECASACLSLLPYCVCGAGIQGRNEIVNRLLDCVAACGAAECMLRRGSALHVHLCRGCAEVCGACAEELEALETSRGDVERCARACRVCEEACRELAG